MDSSFPLSCALVPAPGLQTPLEKVEISSLPPPPPPHPIHGKVRQCGSYYLISIPYSHRNFNDPPCFHGPGARSPLTHGRVSTKKRAREIFIATMTPSSKTPSWMTEMIGFPSLPAHWYSLRVFFFHLSVYFSLSGDVRAAVCSSDAVTTRVCTDGRQGGHAVYCFRLHGVPDVTDGLVLRFPSLSPSLRVRSVRSLAAVSNDTPISSGPKQDNFF